MGFDCIAQTPLGEIYQSQVKARGNVLPLFFDMVKTSWGGGSSDPGQIGSYGYSTLTSGYQGITRILALDTVPSDPPTADTDYDHYCHWRNRWVVTSPYGLSFGFHKKNISCYAWSESSSSSQSAGEAKMRVHGPMRGLWTEHVDLHYGPASSFTPQSLGTPTSYGEIDLPGYTDTWDRTATMPTVTTYTGPPSFYRERYSTFLLFWPFKVYADAPWDGVTMAWNEQYPTT